MDIRTVLGCVQHKHAVFITIRPWRGALTHQCKYVLLIELTTMIYSTERILVSTNVDIQFSIMIAFPEKNSIMYTQSR
jgi:hypothetical protein